MNQINEITINGFFDNDNHELNFTSQTNLLNYVDEFTSYLDNLFILSNEISKKSNSEEDIEKQIINLKLVYISKIVFNVLNTFIDLYDKDNLKDVDKQNILSQLWDKIKPGKTGDVDNLSKRAIELVESSSDSSANILYDGESVNLTSTELLDNIKKIKNIFQKCSEYNDKPISKRSRPHISFEDYNLSFLNFRSNLLSKEYNWPPIFEKEFKISMKKQGTIATLFYLPDKIELSQSSLANFINDINSIYNLNKKLINNENKKNLEILILKSKATDQYKKAASSFPTNTISKINEIYEKSPSLRGLGSDEILIILENTLNIFIYPGLINILKDYTKEESKSSNNKSETPLSDSNVFENNIKILINILNNLKLKNIVWGDNDDKETYKFIPKNFIYKVLNEIDKKKYILELDLNLEYSVINTYLKYNIDFISNDPLIKNIKNYNFKISDSIPDSKISEGNIYLPPLIYSNNNLDPKDVSCCYVLINKDDIKNFNKKNPTISDKEIFTNIGIIDNLVNEIAKNTSNNDYRYKNNEAFKKNIELITHIFFDPHPLTNKYIGFVTKHFSKNNLIFFQGKPYHIINLEINNDGIPDIDKFELNETKKDGKQQISKTYTIKIKLTVANGEKPLTISSSVAASCPEKAKKINDTYRNVTDKIGLLKNYGKEEKIKDRWHLKDGVLRKKNMPDIQNAGKKTKRKKNKRKYTKRKLHLNINKTKRKYTKRKYTKRKNTKRKNTKRKYTKRKYTKRKYTKN